MGPVKKRVEKEGGKEEMITDLHREQQQGVMGISSEEEEEKKTETSLSSNDIRQEAKASVNG
jgi:hypothetical protein